MASLSRASIGKLSGVASSTSNSPLIPSTVLYYCNTCHVFIVSCLYMLDLVVSCVVFKCLSFVVVCCVILPQLEFELNT